MFGHKKVKLNDVRKHLRKWNGWDVDPDSQEHHELQEGIGSVSLSRTLPKIREPWAKNLDRSTDFKGGSKNKILDDN